MRRVLGLRLAAWAVGAALCAMPVYPQQARAGGEGGTATEALRSLMTAGLSAARQGDRAKLEGIARNLMIPEYELWFKAMFGEEEGARLAAAYGSNFDTTEKQYPKLFEWLAQQEGEVVIEDVKTLPKSSESWCGQTLANALKGDIVFYRVSVGKADSSGLRSGRVAGYFALVGGAYRRLDCQLLGLRPETGAAGGAAGPAGANGLPQNPDAAGSLPVRIAGNVQAARSIKKVAPVYPLEARMTRISGTVRIHVIIGKDGRIKQMKLISGHPMLQQAALDAVRQWRYQPTLLNGDPVEVDTTIDIIFQLNW